MFEKKPPLPIEEQIKTLQQISSHKLQGGMLWVSLAAIFILLGLAIIFHETVLAVLTAAPAMIAFATFATGRYISNAYQAWQTGKNERAILVLKIDEWSDSKNFVGQITARDIVWEMTFCPPLGWTPQPGEYKVSAYFCDKAEWPSLIMTDEGILYPQSKPKKQTR